MKLRSGDKVTIRCLDSVYFNGVEVVVDDSQAILVRDKNGLVFMVNWNNIIWLNVTDAVQRTA